MKFAMITFAAAAGSANARVFKTYKGTVFDFNNDCMVACNVPRIRWLDNSGGAHDCIDACPGGVTHVVQETATKVDVKDAGETITKVDVTEAFPDYGLTSPLDKQTFTADMFLDGCDPKNCAQWTCVDWCHCFETNPNVELMFNSVAYGGQLATLCPSDSTPCVC